MKSIKIIVAILVGVFLGGYGVLTTVKAQLAAQPEPSFHEHADFALVINGVPFDFTLNQFMSDKPCTVFEYHPFVETAFAHGGEEDEEFDVHLHDGIGSVIHVHREGIAWHDFFESLGMEFSDTHFADHQGVLHENDETNEWRYFVNGEEVASLVDREIRDLDQVLITYGSVGRSLEDIRPEFSYITNNACESSEACLHRGFPPIESCAVVQPEVPFFLEFLGL